MLKATKNLGATILALFFTGLAWAQDADPQVTLFTNVNVFDGVNEKLIENANVVVTGNKISAVSTEPLAVAGGRVIDGGGRTLMPGLIDAHWHTMFNFSPISNTLGSSFGYLNIAAADASGS
jgi:imidazolonepropionase-like amidohydrolase